MLLKFTSQEILKAVVKGERMQVIFVSPVSQNRFLQEMKQLVKSKNRDLDTSGSHDYCCRYTWTSKCQQELVLEVEVAMQPQLCGLQTR
jgi:hypothetical protein